MKFAVQPAGNTSHVPALTTDVAGVGEFGSIPGQMSVAPGPADGFLTPLVPAASTCALNAGVNHAGGDVLSVVAADAVVALMVRARTAKATSRAPLRAARILLPPWLKCLPVLGRIPGRVSWD